jgi:hypothetical protein
VLFVALAGIGAADAAMDIAMNANGAAYEARSAHSLLHRLHGAWSLGSLSAAAVAAAAAAAGVSLTWHLLAVGVVIAGVSIGSRRWLVADDHVAADVPAGGVAPDAAAPGHPGVAGAADPGPAGSRAPASRPRRWGGPLLALAAVTVAGALIEGAPSDWSALRLERLGTGPGVAALGFAAFSAGMLAGRLAGDRLTDRHGGAAVLRGGMVLVVAGLLVGIAIDTPAAFAIGLVVAGAGASGLFPLAFSAAATTRGVAPGAGAATVSLAARLGFMIEPLLMGTLAQLLGLRSAFLVVAAVAAVVALSARRVLGRTGRVVEGTVTDLRAG